jgi:hypothetical protein
VAKSEEPAEENKQERVDEKDGQDVEIGTVILIEEGIGKPKKRPEQ